MVDEPFDDSGELIALSGGAAGPEAACHTCHGLDGAGDGSLAPRIAGLDAGYLVRQLNFFADGQRSHPQMSWLARRFDTPARAAVAAYYAAMPAPPANGGRASCVPANAAAIYHRGVPGRGLASCASCHADDATGAGAGNPPLVGQSSVYIARQLRDWREGKRYGDPLGVMHKAASGLRKEEIIPLAAYIADGPALSRRPESRAECP